MKTVTKFGDHVSKLQQQGLKSNSLKSNPFQPTLPLERQQTQQDQRRANSHVKDDSHMLTDQTSDNIQMFQQRQRKSSKYKHMPRLKNRIYPQILS